MKVITPVYGVGIEWAQYLKWSVEACSPNLEFVVHKYDPVEVAKALSSRHNPGTNASVKASISRDYEKPFLICDADAFFLDEFDWKPENPDTAIAMAPGGDPKYLNWLMEAGIVQIPEDLEGVFNAGVIWINTDMCDVWQRYYKILDPLVRNPHVTFGEVLWNAVWYHFRKDFLAEILPQRFNQIYLHHGIEGAAILHFAGAPKVYRQQVMGNCFNHFFYGVMGPEGVKSIEHKLWKRK